MTSNNRKRITMSHTTYFQPTVHTARNYSQRTTALYAAAGMTAPASFHQALRRHLATLPGVQQVAATVASDAYRADAADTDLTEFWDDAVDQLIRAQGADTLKAALGTALATEEAASGHRALDRALADTHAWATRQAQALSKASRALPAGAAALDPEAVLAHDAGKALTSARSALAALALVASLGDPARHVGTLGYYAHVMSLVDPGNPTEEVVNGLGTALNTSKLDTTLAIRKLAQDVKTNPDLALVDVARGTYPGVTLDPATTPADIADRATRARTAFTRRTATEHEQSKLIAMR